MRFVNAEWIKTWTMNLLFTTMCCVKINVRKETNDLLNNI